LDVISMLGNLVSAKSYASIAILKPIQSLTYRHEASGQTSKLIEILTCQKRFVQKKSNIA